MTGYVMIAFLIISGLLTGGRFGQWTNAINEREREALFSAVLGWGCAFGWCLVSYIKYLNQ